MHINRSFFVFKNMNFFKKIFGGGEAPHSDADRAAQEDRAEMKHEETPKETHDKEHQGENKKPKNVCEFC